MISERLIETLKRHEGLRLKVYTCPAGKLTVGYGRNLEDRGITEEEADYLLINDIRCVEDALVRALPCFEKLPEAAQEVLINMGFQMGVAGVLGFRKTLEHLKGGRYHEASFEMLNSSWAMQTPRRAGELAEIIRKA